MAYFKHLARADFYLFLVEPIRPTIEIIELDWYDDSYDKGYQGVIGVVEVPDQDKLIVSVQRDSQPVLMDLETKAVIKKLSLANRLGNPTLRFRKHANELWADDYDTILRIYPSNWTVESSMLLQEAATGCQQFIGAFAFSADENLCAIARPFSGDVIAIDTAKFKVTHSCELGDQPLLVTLLSDGTIYSRDWKTGKLLMGTLKRKWFT